MGEKVGRFNASFFTYISSLFSIGTILICYLISVYNGNVHIWLPMISSCGVYRPEKYIFTIGLILSGVALFINSVLFYFYLNTYTLGGRKGIDILALFFSFVSSLGLFFVATANAVDDPVVHIPAAFIFFGFHLAYMMLSTIRLYCYSNCRRCISTKSLIIKTIIIIIASIDITISGMLIALFHYEKHLLLVAITEWIAVILISIFTLSFVLEFGNNEYLGALLLEPYCQSNFLRINSKLNCNKNYDSNSKLNIIDQRVPDYIHSNYN
jgi:hypothetical protein